MSTQNAYHVYGVDGFDSAHRSEAAAVRAAQRGAKRRGSIYIVARTDYQGRTGPGMGTIVAAFDKNGRPLP